jgi:hypothetical protein
LDAVGARRRRGIGRRARRKRFDRQGVALTMGRLTRAPPSGAGVFRAEGLPIRQIVRSLSLRARPCRSGAGAANLKLRAFFAWRANRTRAAAKVVPETASGASSHTQVDPISNTAARATSWHRRIGEAGPFRPQPQSPAAWKNHIANFQ